MTDPLHERVRAALGAQYEIHDEIGRGGMSVVYQARDPRLNRTVAIKVLPPELAYDPAIRARFTREAQMSAQLSHPHIVPIYDVGEQDGLAYFVMSYVAGGSLAARLAGGQRLAVGEVRRILGEVADALAFAHARGVIHRDVKPDNILLDGDTGRALVTDFGIAQAVEAGTRLTLTGIAVGTPTYMSPEQATGERDVDGRSDLYSLGVVAYQMLAGRVPFTAGNSLALLMKHVNETPPAIAALRPDAPAELCAAVERAMAKAPDDRWGTAGALRDAVLHGIAETPSGRARALAPAARAGTAPPLVVEGVELEPAHYAGLTEVQRRDLRIWAGRVNLLDRVRAVRLHVAATVVSLPGFLLVAGAEEFAPLVLGPLVPITLIYRLIARRRSLHAHGLKLRNMVLALSARRAVLPVKKREAPAKPARLPREVRRLAPPEVLASPHGAAIVRAVEGRREVRAILESIPRGDRRRLADVAPAVDALVAHVASTAHAIHRLDTGVDLQQAGARADLPAASRHVTLINRQQETLAALAAHRQGLVDQLDGAGLALDNLRLDLIRYRAAGGEAAFSVVSNATREVRALSQGIGTLLDAEREVRG